MDLTPRNQFNCRLNDRYWQVNIDLPKAVPYNTPIGTHPCDTLGFICHPQTYGKYRNIELESCLYNLDYYNLYDVNCREKINSNKRDSVLDCTSSARRMSPELVKNVFQPPRSNCAQLPGIWNNNTKLWKYNSAQ